MSGRLADKVALITGAGSGIGYAMTRLFGAEGAQVGAIAKRPESLTKLTGLENIFPVEADITRAEDIERMVATLENQFGRINILCNVAGINDLCHPLDATSDEMWDRILTVDLKAPFQICRRVIGGMIEREQGVILNIGSLTAFRGIHGPSYCAAKAGIVGMTQSIAVAYARQNIRCNVLNPGPVVSGIGAASGGNFHAEGYRRAKELLAAMPVSQRCMPEDVAPTALFLCSDEAKHVNGAIVAVDGGMSAC